MSSTGNVYIDLNKLEGIIFDMDGVVTDTAGVHATAWKQLFDEYLEERAQASGGVFEPFDIKTDYHRHLDGRPRYDGVKSFLKSRGIELPQGNPDDTSEQETVCGLGNRKNAYFLERLRKDGVNTFASTVALVDNLRANALPTAVISASRNAEEILKAAGVRERFDVKVDSWDMAELGLKGKPNPAIFLEAARRLGVSVEHTAVVEDALAGVTAGKKGGFGFVIGVDRGVGRENLLSHGASAAVDDLAQLKIRRRRDSAPGALKGLLSLPSALEKKKEIFRRLASDGRLVIFLDYDGTLTPIVSRPEDATLPPKAGEVLQRLAGAGTVAIISGRDLNDVRNMVDVDGVVYAGSHGFDIATPGGASQEEQWRRFMPALDRAEAELEKLLADLSGVRVERKKFAIAVHYRLLDEAYLDTLRERFEQVRAGEPELRMSTGKKVLELRPDIDWDKGKALLFLLETLNLDGEGVVPLFIGDDVTDEDAFKVVAEKGLGIVVGTEDRPTQASYSLKTTDEVNEFLENLADYVGGDVKSGDWVLAYEGFDPEREALREALCTLGNGYFATRGAAPEAQADGVHYPGTYVAGCFNRLKTHVAEHVVEQESMVNVINWLPLRLRLEGGDWFAASDAKLLDYRQELDLRCGLLRRFIRFADAKGRRTRINERRFVHMGNRHLAGLELSVVAENWSGSLDISTALDGSVANTGVARYRELDSVHLSPVEARSFDETAYLRVETNQSHVHIAAAARTHVFRHGEMVETERKIKEKSGYISQEFNLELKEAEEIRIEKIAALFTSRDPAISECGLEAQKAVRRAPDFETLLKHHLMSWEHLWDHCDIEIKKNRQHAVALRLHIFHLLQTVSPNTIDLDVGIPACGLHGEAYRGHIFWDELFIFPFLNLRFPDITRSLLQYRYRRLSEARWAAKKAGYRGAMFPWQSGSDGREESQTLHLNPKSGRWIPDDSQLQRHINVAIAYNVWGYYQVTDDVRFLASCGAEMIIEIARFWASLASYNESLGRYEIRRVMGPDEYHDRYPGATEPGLNNNTYTNIMAVWVMCRALEVLELLPVDNRNTIWDKLGLEQAELTKWEDISRKMRIVFHDDGIISQFEGYDQLEEFDWVGYQDKYGDIQRLDRILEAEGDTTNRYKLSKQADVLMLFYLLSADELRELFERLGYTLKYEAIPRNINYYLKRTSHGSTLSRVVHSWVLARSHRELSWSLLTEAMQTDISDIQGGTTAEGIHLGAMAGTVDIMQRCYAGLEMREDILWFNPCLPYDLKDVKFDIRYRGHHITIQLTSGHLRLSLRPYDVAPLKIGFQDNIYELKPGDSAEIPTTCTTS